MPSNPLVSCHLLTLALAQLWDVCSDQDAVDLIRHTTDPQAASKQLVDHALGRFSTDNLSCMVVRFDGAALRKQTGRPAAHPPPDAIGVDGDPPSRKKGAVSEASAKVRASAERQRQESGVGGVSATAAAAMDGAGESLEERPDEEMSGTGPMGGAGPMGVAKENALAEALVKDEARKETGPEVDPKATTGEVIAGKVGGAAKS